MTRRALLCLGILSVLAQPALAERGDLVSGRASVVDGDTIDIQGQRFRLFGVDAPESAQTCTNAAGAGYRCGQAAAFFLDEIVQKASPISCTIVDYDQWKRAVGVCATPTGLDLSRALVEAGHAIAYRRYSKDYVSAEEAARARGLGVWAGTFQKPDEYRRNVKAAARAKREARSENPWGLPW